MSYDPELQNLEVEFHYDHVYRYHFVPKNVYRRLLAADSKGAFFNDHIRENYITSRLR